MDVLKHILSQEVVHKLGWTLLHSLWQGGVVVLLLAILLRLLRKSSANLRYVVACLGLALITLLPVLTFYVVPAPALTSDMEFFSTSPTLLTGQPREFYDTDMPLQRAAEYMQMFPTISWKQRAMNFYTSALPYIVFGWFVGVLALCLWHLGGWVHLLRLKRTNINQVNASLKDKLGNLAERLKVTRPVKLMESALVQIPTVVGCLRPVILLPVSALTGLTSQQLEAVLAHELAHIYRYDYLVNMLQTVVEIVGFYHPAVWWISHKMRIERENCCDDVAVSVCGDKMVYARALTSMEEIRMDQGELVIAASGGNLFTRISRLVGNESARKARPGWAPAVLCVLLIIALAIPTTLALTAADSGSGLRADSTTVHVSDSVDEENISSSVVLHSRPHLPDVDSKTQILFDCKFFKVPADLEIIEGRPKPVDKQFIDVDRVYAGRLEELSQEREDVKLLVAPQMLVVNGKQATMSAPGVVLKVVGKVKDNAIKVNLYLELSKNNTFTSVVMSEPEETIIVGGLRDSDDLNQSIILTITPHIIASKELADTSIKVEQDRVKRPRLAVSSIESGDLDETATKAQILFDCKICEVPADLKFPKDEPMKGSAGISIQLGREYADSLEALIQETKNAKILSAPRIMIVDGEEAVVSVGADVPYIAGYENGEGAGDEAKPIIKKGFAGLELKIKGKTKENGLKLDLNINYRQLKPGLGTHKDDEGREIQVPVIESRECATAVTVRSGETVVIGGLRSSEEPLSNLILTIIPSIVLPEKGPEQAKIEIEGGAVYGDPGRVVEFSDAENEKIKADQRLAELQSLLIQEEDLKIALEDQALELQQRLHGIQTKLAELETRKAELSELNRLSSALALAKEPKSEHERLAVKAAKFAERGDYTKAIEHIEKAIELAKARKYYGIGIAIGKTDGLIRISDVLPDAPASGSSFQKGDIIEAVDGVSIEGMSLDDVVARIVGPKGTEVTLSVKSHSQDVAEKKTFTRQLPLEGSHVWRAYEWRLAAYKSGKTWPQYRRMMEKPEAQTAGAPRIFAIKYSSAEELAEVLSRILERRWKGVKDRSTQAVRIIPEPNRNRLIVIASPDDIQLIEALIAELDVLAKQDTVVLEAAPGTEYKQDPAAVSTITQVIKLKYADCENVEQILRQILSDEHFKIATDKRTNVLIVAGTKSAIEEIKALVAEIDVSGSDTDREVLDTNKQEKVDSDLTPLPSVK